MTTLADVDALRDVVEIAKAKHTRAAHVYLKECGWVWAHNSPGNLWMWERVMPDGRTLMVSTDSMALDFQRKMEQQ